MSYRQIVQRLHDECHCSVTLSTVFSFIKTRSTRRKVMAMLDNEPASRARRSLPISSPLFEYDDNKPLTLLTRKDAP